MTLHAVSVANFLFCTLSYTFGSTLKLQLQVLLFHLIVSILLALMLALAVSSRLSSLLFPLFILPVNNSKMDQLNIVPGGFLLLSVVVGVLPSLVLVVILVVEWAITAYKVK